MDNSFLGYLRPNGSVGVRNHVLVIPTSIEANHVALRIQRQVPGTVALAHEHGVLQTPRDAARTSRILAGAGLNPNVAAVVIVGLHADDTVSAVVLAEAIANAGTPVEIVSIAALGGTVRAIDEGVRRARQLVRDAERLVREEADLQHLVVGSKCGGSDATSGLACNPALGRAMDEVVLRGGAVVFGETTEIIGAEHLLARRTASPEVAQKLLHCVSRYESAVQKSGVDMRGGNPSPGNIAGGLTTIEEKSLGCISKAGTAVLREVVEYGEAIRGRGLYFMDSPGNDIECVSGMAASGAQIVCFTTGRGTPTGSAVVPVIKLCANPNTNKSMSDDIDVDASALLFGGRSMDAMGREIFARIVAVASGEPVKAELHGHREFSINRIAVSR